MSRLLVQRVRMLNEALIALALGSPPVTPPDVTFLPDRICHSTPRQPVLMDVSEFENTAADGTQTWSITATYGLSSGSVGEAFLVVASDGTGEAYLTIDGAVVAHTAIAFDPASGQPMVTSWWSGSIDAPPELIAEMTRVDLPAIVDGVLPQEFKCSRWGRKVMKAGKYLMVGVIGASGAACCLAAPGPVCVACGAGTAVGIEGVSEFADGYCE